MLRHPALIQRRSPGSAPSYDTDGISAAAKPCASPLCALAAAMSIARRRRSSPSRHAASCGSQLSGSRQAVAGVSPEVAGERRAAAVAGGELGKDPGARGEARRLWWWVREGWGRGWCGGEVGGGSGGEDMGGGNGRGRGRRGGGIGRSGWVIRCGCVSVVVAVVWRGRRLRGRCLVDGHALLRRGRQRRAPIRICAVCRELNSNDESHKCKECEGGMGK